MNSSLRRRLVQKHGEMFVRNLKLIVRPPKVEREPQRTVVHTKRVSRRVLRRRKEVV